MKRPKVVVYQRADGLWEFRVRAANGRIVGPSNQGFTSKRDAWRGFQDARNAFMNAVPS